MKQILTDEEHIKKFDNHEIMFRNVGVQIVNTNNYIFKLEDKVKTQELRLNVLVDVVQKMAERLNQKKVL